MEELSLDEVKVDIKTRSTGFLQQEIIKVEIEIEKVE